MYERILVPTDGSDHAARAAEHAGYLAGLFDATVHVVGVVDVQSAAGPFDAGGVDEAFVDRLAAEAQRSVEDVASLLGGDVTVLTAVLRGEPAETILEYAGEEGVGLVAMGTHGRRGLSRYVAGSVTERVLRLAEIPVLTVRATDRSRTDYEEILLPTDGSEHAEAAVDHALAIAGATGARVHAVSVVDVAEFAIGPDGSPPAGLIDRLENDARAATESVAQRAEAAGVDVVASVEQGNPSDALLAYAEEAGVDLVAMGTHGRRGLRRLLLGSTTERTIRRADVPVLAASSGE